MNPEHRIHVQGIGITGHKSSAVLMDALRRDTENVIDTLLVALNANDRHYCCHQNNVLPVALAKGMGVIAMKVFGVDANIVALSGIAIAIGTMVDMGIVITENIHRHLTEKPPEKSRRKAIHEATTEVAGAVKCPQSRFQAVDDVARADNGRRVYTSADVEKLGLLKRLTDQGVSIGRIAGDSLEELHARLRDMDEIASTPAPQRIRAAVLGEFLPGQLVAYEGDLTPVDIVVAGQGPQVVGAPPDQVERQALGRLGADPGQLAQLVDEAGQGARKGRHGGRLASEHAGQSRHAAADLAGDLLLQLRRPLSHLLLHLGVQYEEAGEIPAPSTWSL